MVKGDSVDVMANEFVSKEERDFPFRIGKALASGLAGFVAGSIFASIIWVFALWFLRAYGFFAI